MDINHLISIVWWEPVHHLLRAVMNFAIVLVSLKLIVRVQSWRSLAVPVFVAVFLAEIFLYAVDVVTSTAFLGDQSPQNSKAAQNVHVLALVAAICLAGTLLTRQLAQKGITRPRHVGAKTMIIACIFEPIFDVGLLALFHLVQGDWRIGLAFAILACLIFAVVATPLNKLRFGPSTISETGPSTADYHRLIAGAVLRLDRDTADARQTLYERARMALVEQMRRRDPPASELEITQQLQALAAAIHKVEAEASLKPDHEPKAKAQVVLPKLSRRAWILRSAFALAVAVGLGAILLLWLQPYQQKHELSIAQRFEFGGQAEKHGDYDFAYELTRPLAEGGDVNAQVNLAIILWHKALSFSSKSSEDPKIISQNRKEQFRWWCSAAMLDDAEAQQHLGLMLINDSAKETVYSWQHAAEGGNPDGQNGLAWVYHFGMYGVAKDEKEALRLLHAAADAGHDDAQETLGDIYWDGKGHSKPPWTMVQQDYTEAAKWYLAAANRNNSGAQEKLGLMYYKGLGVLQDYVQAYVWLNLAAASWTLEEAIKSAAQMRDEVASHLTAERVIFAQQPITPSKAGGLKGNRHRRL